MAGYNSKKIMAFHGRGFGKSVWANMVKELTMPNVKILSSAKVDEKTWYTLQLSMPVGEWLRSQPKDDWYEHTTQGCFDVSEQMYSALMLKWK